MMVGLAYLAGISSAHYKIYNYNMATQLCSRQASCLGTSTSLRPTSTSGRCNGHTSRCTHLFINRYFARSWLGWGSFEKRDEWVPGCVLDLPCWNPALLDFPSAVCLSRQAEAAATTEGKELMYLLRPSLFICLTLRTPWPLLQMQHQPAQKFCRSQVKSFLFWETFIYFARASMQEALCGLAQVNVINPW